MTRAQWYRRRFIPLWWSVPWYVGAMLAILIAVIGGERLTFDVRWSWSGPVTLADFGISVLVGWSVCARWMIDRPLRRAVTRRKAAIR